MKLLCITDPKTHPPLDGTVGLYTTFAKHPDIELFHCPTSSISEKESVKVHEIPEPLEYEAFLELDAACEQETSISDFDLVFCRTDKPFPEKYLQDLSSFEDKVRFVNKPSAILKFASTLETAKIIGKYLPDHIFSRSSDEIKDFFDQHGTIIAKQNEGYGGKWVYKIWEEDSSYMIDNVQDGKREFFDFPDLVSYLNNKNPEPYQYVRYLSRVNEGDKRVHVTDGNIMGAILRKTEDSSSWIQNLTSGAKAYEAEITDSERETVENTASEFHEAGIYTLGYDFLTDEDGTSILSEINVGNIGGYNRYEMLSGRDVSKELADWMIDFSKRTF